METHTSLRFELSAPVFFPRRTVRKQKCALLISYAPGEFLIIFSRDVGQIDKTCHMQELQLLLSFFM